MNFPTIVASIGVGLLLLAFILNLFQKIHQSSYFYICLNLLGAAIACYASYLISFVPFVVLEGTWGLVALAGLAKKVSKKIMDTI